MVRPLIISERADGGRDVHGASSADRRTPPGNPAAAALPRTHVRCVDGPSRVRVRVRELRGGHDCVGTVPGEPAELLLRAAVRPF
ncbi:hypothetical protein ACFY00_24600 [Kitasatospora sp. NPDC001540]|uniref:hypothetical protein n=1 Tax=Kitasatospora sp. NPDC001540 TaxID=3364014 RepID=UPI0036C89337